MPKKFKNVSPDPYLRTGEDMGLAKFGHLNFLLGQLNDNVHADNAAAKTAGLKAGDFYRTATGQVHIVYD
jgi:hypothetical protein